MSLIMILLPVIISLAILFTVHFELSVLSWICIFFTGYIISASGFAKASIDERPLIFSSPKVIAQYNIMFFYNIVLLIMCFWQNWKIGLLTLFGAVFLRQISYYAFLFLFAGWLSK